MKRFFPLFLILCLLLSGCGLAGEHFKEPVPFYYLRSEYEYFTQDGVIVSEEREASGHREDLTYLLALYLMGPSEEELVSPLPRGIRIFKSEQTTDGITLQLSDSTATMTDLDFSLACACLTLTCLDISEEETVMILWGEEIITMDESCLTLFDNSLQIPVE